MPLGKSFCLHQLGFLDLANGVVAPIQKDGGGKVSGAELSTELRLSVNDIPSLLPLALRGVFRPLDASLTRTKALLPRPLPLLQTQGGSGRSLALELQTAASGDVGESQ